MEVPTSLSKVVVFHLLLVEEIISVTTWNCGGITGHFFINR